MKTIKYLIEKEFKQIIRNPIIVSMIIGYPIMVLALFPWAIDNEVKNIRINIVDNSKSSFSQRLINKIDATSYFILNDVTNSYESSLHDMETGECDIILEIPAAFDNNLIKEQKATISIASNAVNTTQGLIGNNYLMEVISDFSSDLLYEIQPILNMQRIPTLEVVPNHRYNPKLDFKHFMLPAFIVLMITLICGILPSLNLILEKEMGTIYQINTTPVSKFTFILSKVIPYWIIGIIILTISIFIIWAIYDLFPTGSIIALYTSAFIFILGITGLSIVISNYSSTLRQSMFLIMFFILIIILLSGMFTPVSSMPIWAQAIAYINPLSHFIEIMRLIYQKANLFNDLLQPMGLLVLFALLFNGWAVLSYKKSS